MLHESYNVVEILMQHAANHTTQSELDRACDQFITWSNCHPFDQETHDKHIHAMHAAEQVHTLKK